MRTRLAIFILLGVALVFGLLFGRQAYLSKDLPRQDFETPKLFLLTYSTFVGTTGPGAELIRQFEEQNNVDVQVVTSGDAGLLLERLKVAETGGSPFDVVIGLDQLLVPGAEKSFKWKELFFGSSGRNPLLAEFASPYFVPYDWSPLGFIYRKDKGESASGFVPTKIDDLKDPRLKKQLALQDPRSSTPGLQFFQWVKTLKGDQTPEFLKRMQPNVNSISPSWAFSYGLFKKEQTRFVWSYLTSLAFHWGVEEDRGYGIAIMDEGHPAQVEYVAIPAACRQCELAEKFVALMLQPEAQKLIMEKNFMLPVIQGLEAGTIFEQLPTLKVITTGRGKDLREWDQVFR